MSITRVGGGSASLALPSGSVMVYAGATAPDGWLLCRGQAISRSTYPELFAVLSTTYGAGDGSTTFNLPNLLGRVPVGQNPGGTFATLAEAGGAETVTLTGAQSGMPSHGHTLSLSISDHPGHTHTFTSDSVSTSHTHSGRTFVEGAHGHSVGTVVTSASSNNNFSGGGSKVGLVSVGTTSISLVNQGSHDHGFNTSSGGGSHSHSGTSAANLAQSHAYSSSVGSAAATNASQSHTNIQPYLVMNYIIKT